MRLGSAKIGKTEFLRFVVALAFRYLYIRWDSAQLIYVQIEGMASTFSEYGLLPLE